MNKRVLYLVVIAAVMAVLQGCLVVEGQTPGEPAAKVESAIQRAERARVIYCLTMTEQERLALREKATDGKVGIDCTDVLAKFPEASSP